MNAKPAPTISTLRLWVGFGLVVSACVVPLLIPLVWMLDLSTAVKASLSALMALGLPEVLVVAAVPVLGRRRLSYCWIWILRQLAKIWRRVRPVLLRR